MIDLTVPLAPIQQEALELLEWPRLAEQLASFASTAPGRCACLELALPDCLFLRCGCARFCRSASTGCWRGD